MFIPTKFEQQDPEALNDLIRKHPLATLVMNSSSGLNANHIPLQLTQNSSGKVVLQGHIAKANPLWKDSSSTEALAIFQGADSYISPNWYPSKQENGKVVPTWNYMAVHASGQIRFIHDPDWIRAFLERLTTEHESNQETPWAMSDAPEEFTQKMLSAIVGFEITVQNIIGKWKMSQNQTEENRTGVVNGLSASPDTRAKALASIMEEQAPVDG